MRPDEIGYVNAHGTSTPENDKMEHMSLSAVFGERICDIPVSSNKSMIGHTLSAAGAVEAVFSILTMREGIIPPTINHDNPDPAIQLDVRAECGETGLRQLGPVQFLRLRRTEHLPCHGARNRSNPPRKNRISGKTCAHCSLSRSESSRSSTSPSRTATRFRRQ